MFSENQFEKFSGNKLEDLKVLLDKYKEWEQKNALKLKSIGGMKELYEELLKGYAILQVFCKANQISLNFPELSDANRSDNYARIRQVFLNFLPDKIEAMALQLENSKFETIKNDISIKMGKGFYYEFSQSQLDFIQEKINKLRDLIATSEFFEEEHRQRLLKRLEKLQSELHKKVSDLDRFWGFIGDAGIALRKFGQDAKPIVDRVKEITGVIWRAQCDAEGIESDVPNPLISPPEE